MAWPPGKDRGPIIEKFLIALTQPNATVARAAAVVSDKVTRKTLYVWRDEDSDEGRAFKEAWQEAQEAGTEELEGIATDFAIGEQEKYEYVDPETGEREWRTRRVNVDGKMLAILLRARNRRRFGQTAVDLRTESGAINVILGQDDLEL